MTPQQPATPPARIRVAAVGLRGIPNIQGGVESHVQALYARLPADRFDLTVYCRRPFVPADLPARWENIRLHTMWSPAQSGLESFVHSLLATLQARRDGIDIVHLHAVGPSLMTPLARLLGMKVVATHHGRDYEREKWGNMARWLLRQGEHLAARFANKMVCVAANDADRINATWGAGTAVHIPNGAPRFPAPDAPDVLAELGVAPRRYILNVARRVPEKRQLDLIRAFGKLDRPDWKLVLVGSALHASDYDTELCQLAQNTPNVVLAGARGGAQLATLYAHAGLFVLPSSLEGLPITLLEALSFGLPCVASGIPANREVNLPDADYFPVGDLERLHDRLAAHTAPNALARLDALPVGQDMTYLPAIYRWEHVASATCALLLELAGADASGAAADGSTSAPASGGDNPPAPVQPSRTIAPQPPETVV